MDPEESAAAAPSEPGPPPGPAASPAPDAAAFFRQLGEQTSQVLTAAEEAGRGIREQARRDAAGIIAEARIQANELAMAAAAERRGAEEELRRFREARTILANQIEDVHRRLEEIILRLRTPVEAPDSAPPPRKGVAKEPAKAVPVVPAGPAPGTVPLAAPAPAEAEPPAAEAPAAEPPPAEAHAAEARRHPEPASGPLAEVLRLEPLPVPDVEEPGAALGPVTEAVAAVDVDEAGAVEEVFVEELLVDEPPLEGPFAVRGEALGDAPLLAGRSLKRLLQEDQNDLLDRIRRHRGRGTFEEDILPAAVQVERFVEGMRPVLEPAFLAGREAGGGLSVGEPPDVVGALVAKQVVAALRRDLGRMIEPRLAAGDTATTVSERAGDVYRVWKGVRTELLGEGLVYAAFHHGLLDAWREAHGPGKVWLLSADEADCPRDTCRTNAAAGVVAIDATFPSGHLAPPAHGGCTCTVVAAGE